MILETDTESEIEIDKTGGGNVEMTDSMLL